MPLREYARKRDFSKTPEPGPAAGPRKRNALRFVIQKHDASHLHYDFRLELDGVLKSWAVPKGPSLDPATKRLAMMVEDHPVSYGDFEGTIPKGQYGGGTVLLWDTGAWTPLEENPAAALRKGSLKFTLDGQKLHGSWALVRAFSRDRDDRGNSWLLIKHKDKHARAGRPITETKPLSVKTGRDLDEIAADPSSDVHQSNRDSGKHSTPAKPAKSSKASKTARKPAKSRARSRTVRRGSARPATGEELGAGELPGARPVSPVPDYSPQLCTLADHVPSGSDWVHEIKFDGYRFLAYRIDGATRLVSRRGRDWTSRFRPVADAVDALPFGDLVLDGEAAILAANGKTSFQALQQAIKARRFERLAFYLFDVLYAEGFDLTRATLLTRKNLLRRIIPDEAGLIRYSDHVARGGDEVRAQACRLGLEGVISKRADSPYTQARGAAWLKIKCGLRQEFIIVGYTDPEGSRSHFGSLILAAHDADGRLVHTGRVGTGFNAALLRDIADRFKPRQRSPLKVTPPPDQVRGVHWLEPLLVAEVSFTEWTEDGRLRHPSFEGLREDKAAADVRIEIPRRTEIIASDLGGNNAEMEGPVARQRKSRSAGRSRRSTRKAASPRPPAARRAPTNSRRSRQAAPRSVAPRTPASRHEAPEIDGVVITHPDRVLYPEIELTKLQLARYHEQTAEFSLPYLVDRPLSTVRCPSGRTGECFFQKHVRNIFTEPVHPLRVKESDGVEEYISIDSRAGLIKLAQLGVIEIHPWGSKKPDIEHPDWLTFDLDPGPGLTFSDVKSGARRVREVLAAVGLESFLKTSGGKGLHIVVPLEPSATWEVAKEFAAAVANRIAADEPDRYVSNMAKSRRAGKIFVDYLRNGRGATSVAPYSPRARENAPVSMPIAWDDLPRLKSPAQYTVGNTPAHIARRRKDPWRDFYATRQRLPSGR